LKSKRNGLCWAPGRPPPREADHGICHRIATGTCPNRSQSDSTPLSAVSTTVAARSSVFPKR